jgi:hypothetical protein
MKKIVLAIVLVVTATTSTKAINPVDCDVFCKLNDSVAFTGIMKYIDADSEQAEHLKYICEITELRMKAALKDGDEAKAEKAMNFNLANAKNTLSGYQYKKYLTLINLTANNRYEELLFSENTVK